MLIIRLDKWLESSPSLPIFSMAPDHFTLACTVGRALLRLSQVIINTNGEERSDNDAWCIASEHQITELIRLNVC